LSLKDEDEDKDLMSKVEDKDDWSSRILEDKDFPPGQHTGSQINARDFKKYRVVRVPAIL